jgi:PleD family two-component response regulator
MLVETMLNKVRTITELNFVNIVKVNTPLSMETGSQVEALKLLVVGNNPIELSKILEKIEKIDRPKEVRIAFDFHSILDRLQTFRPDFILIDDNIGRTELRHVVDEMLSERRTKNVPIMVLKNSNYHEAIGTGVMDFILKENLSAEAIYKALRNTLKIRKTQLYLYNSYKKRKGQLMRLFRNSEPAFQI